jgi:hypothetical protein
MPVLPEVGSTRVVCSNQEMHHGVRLPNQIVICSNCSVLKTV